MKQNKNETQAPEGGDIAKATTDVVDAIKHLGSESRVRVIKAACILLGVELPSAPPSRPRDPYSQGMASR